MSLLVVILLEMRNMLRCQRNALPRGGALAQAGSKCEG